MKSKATIRVEAQKNIYINIRIFMEENVTPHT